MVYILIVLYGYVGTREKLRTVLCLWCSNAPHAHYVRAQSEQTANTAATTRSKHALTHRACSYSAKHAQLRSTPANPNLSSLAGTQPFPQQNGHHVTSHYCCSHDITPCSSERTIAGRNWRVDVGYRYDSGSNIFPLVFAFFFQFRITGAGLVTVD